MESYDFVGNMGKHIGLEENMDIPTPSDLEEELKHLGFHVDHLELDFKDGVVDVKGIVKSQEVREKIILVLGNIFGVSTVINHIEVVTMGPRAVFCTVYRGDSLSKIAYRYFGNAFKYKAIYEANRPMLEAPDKIYPGQVLRIPPLK